MLYCEPEDELLDIETERWWDSHGVSNPTGKANG